MATFIDRLYATARHPWRQRGPGAMLLSDTPGPRPTSWADRLLVLWQLLGILAALGLLALLLSASIA